MGLPLSRSKENFERRGGEASPRFLSTECQASASTVSGSLGLADSLAAEAQECASLCRIGDLDAELNGSGYIFIALSSFLGRPCGTILLLRPKMASISY